MKAINLLEAIGNADDAMIADADKKPKPVYMNISKWGVIAACAVISIAVLAAVTAGGFRLKKQPVYEEAASADESCLLPAEMFDSFAPEDAEQENDEFIASGAADEAPEEAPDAINTKSSQAYQSVHDSDSDSIKSEKSSAYQSADSDSDGIKTETCAFVSSYGPDTYDAGMVAGNGSFVLSKSLSDAVEDYGSSVRYRVVLLPFSGGVRLDAADDPVTREIERLAAEGYTVAYETMSDGNNIVSYLTLHATAEQISSFACPENIGYYIVFYNEIAGGGESADQPAEINSAAEIIREFNN